jgi:hypothetical protein
MTPSAQTNQVLEPLTRRKAWKKLQTHHKKLSEAQFGKTPEQVKAEGTPDWLAPHRVSSKATGRAAARSRQFDE